MWSIAAYGRRSTNAPLIPNASSSATSCNSAHAKAFFSAVEISQGLGFFKPKGRGLWKIWALACGDAARARRGPEEADAETVRVGVLLDELDFPGAHPTLAMLSGV